MQPQQIDFDLAKLLGWAALEADDYFIDYADDRQHIHHWRGIPPGGEHTVLLPRWASDANAQLRLCRQLGWRIAYHPTETLNIAIVRNGKQQYGGSHPDSITMAGAFALYQALKDRK